MHKVIFIVGPTGVGKSAVAEELAEQLGGTIVNGDMGQLYAPLSIGTAKPSLPHARVVHDLFDILHEPRDFSAPAYRALVAEYLAKRAPSSAPVIIVGGSLFYILGLFFKLQSTAQGARTLDDVYASDSQSYEEEEEQRRRKWEELALRDPRRSAMIHYRDTYRVSRALTALDMGERPSEWGEAVYDPIVHDYTVLHLVRDRASLYNRINLRVLEMLRDGWVEEVEQLDETWKRWLCKKKIIGYDTLVRALQETERAEIISRVSSCIQKRTRRYAKRQLSFWSLLQRRLEKYAPERIHSINLDLTEPVATGEHDLTLSKNALYLKKFLMTLNA